jgi:hypothetical protein
MSTPTVRLVVLVLTILGFQAPLAATDSDSALLLALKACLSQAAQSASCLDRLFRDFLTQRPAAEALGLIQDFQERDAEIRLSCHPIVHAVGRELFQGVGTIHGAFRFCDQTCQSGCYHGAVERFLWGNARDANAPPHVNRAILQKKAAEACAPSEALRIRYQCLHGLGHAILYFSRYRLTDALEICDQLPDTWSRRSCYGGVFMENLTAASAAMRSVSTTDYHYPCNQVAPHYRSECYLMQTSRMIEMGLSLPQLFEQCAEADSYRPVCIQSIGRDLSNEARTLGPGSVAAKCALVAGADRAACIRGVLYALLDNTWDGTYAFPFCTALRETDDASYCFRLGTSYLQHTLGQNAARIRSECRRTLDDASACVAQVSP